MSAVTVEIRLENVSLKQLHDELGKLCFAGFGDSLVGFRCSGSGSSQSPWVVVKAFKPGAGDNPAPKAARR